MDILKIAARVASGPMEPVYMSIQVPEGMDEAEAVRRAKALLPCATGLWEPVDSGPGWYAGNMECEAPYYDQSGPHTAEGPDDADVTVEWEKP